MLVSTFLPWLTDPIMGNATAWGLPLDIGWQFHVGFVNYGVLCAGCAAYLFFVAYKTLEGANSSRPSALPTREADVMNRSFRGSRIMAIAGLICFVPLILLILQYTCIDIVASTILAHHKIQSLLIQQHFGYGAPADRIKMQPFDVDASTMRGRFMLLINQVSIGALLPLVSAWLLLDYGRLASRAIENMQGNQGTHKTQGKRRWLIWLVVSSLVLLLFGIGPLATFCDYEAKLLLSSGNYNQALHWLNRAYMLSPALEQVPSYHIERGQAMYFLHPDQQSDDSRIYLAWVYRGQHDYLDAYQELLPVWQTHRHESWAVSEMSTTLEYLSEYTKSLNGTVVQRPLNDDTALRWLQQLTIVDSSNVYGQYQVGRIQCDLHNYSACTGYMLTTLRESNNADVQSSAYTYIALSDVGLGEYARARDQFFQAVQLDPNYRNNTAREELSGLH